VRGAKGRSRQTVPFRIKPDAGQVSENAIESGSKESWNVLHDDVSGSKLANHPEHLGPKTRLLSVDACSPSRKAEVLTGEPPTDEINPFGRIAPHVSHVFEAGDSGPVSGKHPASVLIGLALPHDSHSCSFQSEVEAADACKERSDIHAAALCDVRSVLGHSEELIQLGSRFGGHQHNKAEAPACSAALTRASRSGALKFE
jgi:hypothetical protein